jgi:hypothetical protein
VPDPCVASRELLADDALRVSVLSSHASDWTSPTVNATGSAGAAVTYSASATDAVDPNPVVTCSPTSAGTARSR